MGTAVVRDARTLSRKREGPQVLRQTPPGRVTEGRRMTRLASNRTGGNSLHGMIRGGGGNKSMAWCPFATKSERVDILEGTGLHSIAPPPYSTTWTKADLASWIINFSQRRMVRAESSHNNFDGY